jgi:predicted RNA-binding protein with RPS1 domain
MRILNAEEIAAFVRDELLNSKRGRPVVAVTTLPHSQATWLDPDSLEAALAGAADVVRIETGDPTWELAKHLPFRLDVYGGALRIWRPGLCADSDPHDHELYFVHSAQQAQAVQSRIVQAIRPAVARKVEPELAWQRVAQEWSPGDVLEGRVQSIRDFGFFVDLLPGVVGLVHKSEIDWTFVEDPRDFVHRDAIVKVQILAIHAEERRIELSLKRARSESPSAPISLVPGGRPFVWTDARPKSSEASDKIAELEERLERVSEEAEAAATDRADLAEQIKALRIQLTEARRALRSERDAHAAFERRVSPELDPLSSERAFLLAVRFCHARMFDEDSRVEHPLRRMRVGRRFLDSARELNSLDTGKLVEVSAQVACNVAQDIPGREVHQLRAGERGARGRRRDADGAVAWRCSIQDNSPSARRLHWWSVPCQDGGTIEFALACVHDEFDIPE